MPFDGLAGQPGRQTVVPERAWLHQTTINLPAAATTTVPTNGFACEGLSRFSYAITMSAAPTRDMVVEIRAINPASGGGNSNAVIDTFTWPAGTLFMRGDLHIVASRMEIRFQNTAAGAILETIAQMLLWATSTS